MSPWRPEPVLLGISASHAAIRGIDATIERLDGGLAAWLAQQHNAIPRKQPWRVGFSTEVSRHWLLTPPPGLSSLAELQAFATTRFQALFGEPPTDWHITADWHASHPFLCAALPLRLTSPLDDAARAHHSKVSYSTTVGGLFHAYLPKLPKDGWSAVRTPSSLLVLHGTQGRMTDFRVIPTSPDLSASERRAHAITEVQRAAMRTGQALVGGIKWLDCSGTQAAHTAPPEPLEAVEANLPESHACEAVLAALLA